MKKRVFSALLCLVMVIGLLPGIALADQKAAPEAPAATQIPMTYTVYCKDHGTESVNLIWDTFEIGDVTEVEGEYVCPITIETAEYAKAYSTEHGEHAALAEKVTFNMKWDGLKWRDPAMTELPMIEVACVPDAPVADLIPLEYFVGCACYVYDHDGIWVDLIDDTAKMGEVAMVDGKFVCPFTIETAPYVEEYSKKFGKHVAEFESVTFNMTWNGLKWVVPEENELSIAAFCAPAMTAIPTEYIVSCEKHDAMQMNLLPDTLEMGEVAKVDDEFVCPVTIKTAPYAEAYSAKYGKHAAVEDEISFNMTWNYQEEKWEAPAMTAMPAINVECVVPEAPAMTAIPTDYIVSCGKHGGEMTKLLPDTFTIGEVTEKDGQYICPITIATEKYAEAYSTRVHGKHVAKAETITFNMTWNGEAWEAPAMTAMPVIELECVVPAAPAANELPARYFVSCEEHESTWMFEIPGTVKIGEVTQQPSGDYVCTITVSTADYAEVYSEKHEGHTAVVDSVSYTMAWNGRKWVAPAMTELPVIALECVVTEPAAPAAPAANELPMGYMVKCNQGRLFHGARFIYQQPESFTIGEVEKVGDTYVCTITVDTEQYAKAYSNCLGIRKMHTAVNETISFQMTWNGEKWVAPAYTELPVINVACARTNSWFPVNFPWLKW